MDMAAVTEDTAAGTAGIGGNGGTEVMAVIPPGDSAELRTAGMPARTASTVNLAAPAHAARWVVSAADSADTAGTEDMAIPHSADMRRKRRLVREQASGLWVRRPQLLALRPEARSSLPPQAARPVRIRRIRRVSWPIRWTIPCSFRPMPSNTRRF